MVKYASSQPALALLFAGTAQARVGLYRQESFTGIFPDFTGAINTLATKSAPLTITVTSTFNASTPTYVDLNALINTTTTLDHYGCVSCIRGGNLWCANSFNKELASTTTDWTAPTYILASDGILQSRAYGAAQDGGQCCNSAYETATVNMDIWYNSVVSSTSSDTNNYYTCWVRYTNDKAGLKDGNLRAGGATAVTGTVGAQTATEAVSLNHWWCSSGRYNKGTSTTVQAIKPSKWLMLTPATGITSTTTLLGDPRTELMLTACRQRQSVCGGSALIPETSTTTTDRQRIISATKFNVYQKCTWIFFSKNSAPTFSVAQETTTSAARLHSLYDLHYIEYTSSSTAQPTLQDTNWAGMTGTGWQKMLNPVESSWDNLRARLYDTTIQAGTQIQPNVWSWDVNVSTNAAINQKRWFPPTVIADNITRVKARFATYTSAKGTYDTAVAEYNTKVKDWNQMKKDEKDLWKAWFDPPKKVVLPDRPNKPTVPGSYTGPQLQALPTYATASLSTTSAYLGTFFASASTQRVGANKFAVSGDNGGWGSWTMGLLKATTLPISRSYGVFGMATASDTLAQKRSFVENPEQMCISMTTKTSCLSDQTVVNAVYHIVVVSVWANDSTAFAFDNSVSNDNKSSFKITFAESTWASYASSTGAWYPPTAPSAAADPNKPDGAKALCAATAVAAAVAAALY